MEGNKVQLSVFFIVYSLTQQINVYVEKEQTLRAFRWAILLNTNPTIHAIQTAGLTR